MDWALAGRAAIVLAAGVFAALGNPVVRALLRRIDRAAVASADDEVAQTRARLGLEQAQKELPGGRWIGILERIAVYACIVAEFPAGIAIVLAVKGLGRYADLATESESGTSRKGELFIIGTFVSVLFACACAGLAAWLIRLF